MIDINTYRFRIGIFIHGRSRFRKTGGITRICTPGVGLKLILLLVLACANWQPFFRTPTNVEEYSCSKYIGSRASLQNIIDSEEYIPLRSKICYVDVQSLAEYLPLSNPFMYKDRLFVTWESLCQENFRMKSPNFLNRYVNGNGNQRIRGIKNMHLNIRSLSNKVYEVKRIVNLHKPHILGVSECELRKKNGFFDESKLKVPGYTILYPNSWSKHGFARVVIYVKNTLEYQQLDDLQDDLVQSIWFKGGFKMGKRIYFCHFYREHTSSLGNSIRAQRESLSKFLSQWEAATTHDNPNEPNEIHLCGDMNLDSLNGKWLNSNYHLISLSRLVQETCNLLNFEQQVKVPTRAQFDSVNRYTSLSCLDHAYFNAKFRCSNIEVIPFGNSDHNLISYVRFSKEPVNPSHTIVKRSFKDFDPNSFIEEVSLIDWSPVYRSKDLDLAVCNFTLLYLAVLNQHAPWVRLQQRKHYAPWISSKTKELITERDKWKDIDYSS